MYTTKSLAIYFADLVRKIISVEKVIVSKKTDIK